MMQAPVALNHPRLTVLRQTLIFTAERTGRLPDWLGSTWRGAFGRELKSLVCVTGLQTCESCSLVRQCPYPRVFETPPDPSRGKMRKYTDVPRPYVLLSSPGGTITAGQSLQLEYRLFGREIQHRALLVSALERAAARGLGRSSVPLRLDQVAQAETETLDEAFDVLPAPSATLTLELLQPLRLRVRGTPVGPGDLTFGDLFSALLRRISMLCTFHQQPFETDFRGLVAQARELDWLQRDLRLKPLKRYSNRQQRAIDLSGLVGTLVLSATAAKPFLPYLQIGQHTLVGRGAVMGLGEYRIQADV